MFSARDDRGFCLVTGIAHLRKAVTDEHEGTVARSAAVNKRNTVAKRAPVSVHPPRISEHVTRDWTAGSMVQRRRL